MANVGQNRPCSKQRFWRLPDVCHPAKHDQIWTFYDKPSAYWNRKSRTKKSPVWGNTLDTSAIWCNTQIGCRPKGGSARTARVLKKTGSEILIWKISSVCQCHESRSRSSDATVGAMPPLDLPSCQIWYVYLTSRRWNGSRNTGSVLRVPKIRGLLCTSISRKQ